MPGYPRPAPAFRWYSWWMPMGLIAAEEDDWEVLLAEDEAILAEPAPDTDAPDVAHLAEILSDDRTTPLHQDAEDHGGPRG